MLNRGQETSGPVVEGSGAARSSLRANVTIWAAVCAVFALVLFFFVPLFFRASHKTHEPGDPPRYLDAVSEVAWTWKAPGESEDLDIPEGGRSGPVLHETGEGVIVLTGEGATALSGENGEELWSYHDQGKGLLGNVTDNGEYVALHDDQESRVLLLESGTGEVTHEYSLDLSEFEHLHHRVRPGHVFDPLRGFSGTAWTVNTKESVISYSPEEMEIEWEASGVPGCSGEGSVDGLNVQDEVVVAATTCYEQPEDSEHDMAWTLNWDFTSELVGIDPDDGKELWRIEHSVGDMPGESIQRDISPWSGGLVSIDYLDSRDLGHSVLDVGAQEAAYVGERELLWVSPDGGYLGLWDFETGEYEIQDRSGNIERSAIPENVSMSEDIVADGHRVGLEGGVLYLEERVGDASGPEGFARFEGFEGSSSLVRGEEGIYIHGARSVPGAVAVSYTSGDYDGVMGLH